MNKDGHCVSKENFMKLQQSVTKKIIKCKNCGTKFEHFQRFKSGKKKENCDDCLRAYHYARRAKHGTTMQP